MVPLLRTADIASISFGTRSEEHTSELQSQLHLVCRLLLEKKKSSQHSRPLWMMPLMSWLLSMVDTSSILSCPYLFIILTSFSSVSFSSFDAHDEPTIIRM